MGPQSTVRIGLVRKPVGLGGEVRVEALTDSPARFRVGLEVRVNQRATVIEGVHASGSDLTVKLKGVDDVTAAEGLRGEYVEVPAENAEPLPEGRYYHWQLVGMRAVDPRGAILGEIVDVQQYPANDVIVVKKGKDELLVPAVETVVTDVDLGAGRIVVDLPLEEEVR